MNDRSLIDCDTVDELAPAYAVDAVSIDETRAVSDHLESCDRPHVETRELISAAAFVPDAVEPMPPSAGLRVRLMATVAATPQEHRPAVVPAFDTPPHHARAPWWRFAPLPSAIAAVAMAVAIGLGAWNLSLSHQLADRDEALRAVAAADAAYVAEGAAGRGWVIESGDQAIFMADGLAELAAGELYEFWLIDAEGNAVAAGTLADADGVALVTLERGLEDATTFAVTIETERVEQSVNDPVMVATLQG